MMTSVAEILRVSFPAPMMLVLLCFIIVTICLTGDTMLNKLTPQSSTAKQNSAMMRALIDSSTHGLVGFFVWALVENSSFLTDWSMWLNCVAAGVLASSVDVDHFLAAKSFSLKDALNLDKRPPFHNTSLVFVLTLACILLNKWRPRMWVFGLMLLSSWLSHHIRDANHRGLWLSPFGHTPVFSTPLYITCILILAVCIRICFVLVKYRSLGTSDNIVQIL